MRSAGGEHPGSLRRGGVSRERHRLRRRGADRETARARAHGRHGRRRTARRRRCELGDHRPHRGVRGRPARDARRAAVRRLDPRPGRPDHRGDPRRDPRPRVRLRSVHRRSRAGEGGRHPGPHRAGRVRPRRVHREREGRPRHDHRRRAAPRDRVRHRDDGRRRRRRPGCARGRRDALEQRRVGRLGLLLLVGGPDLGIRRGGHPRSGAQRRGSDQRLRRSKRRLPHRVGREPARGAAVLARAHLRPVRRERAAGAREAARRTRHLRPGCREGRPHHRGRGRHVEPVARRGDRSRTDRRRDEWLRTSPPARRRLGGGGPEGDEPPARPDRA